MPNSVSTREIIDMLIAHVSQLRRDQDLSYWWTWAPSEIYEEIKLHLHGELLVINNVSTMMALDIASRIQERFAHGGNHSACKGAWEVETRYYAGVLPGNKLLFPVFLVKYLPQAKRYCTALSGS
jgi:hypothetical protein